MFVLFLMFLLVLAPQVSHAAVESPDDGWQRGEQERLSGFINTLPPALHPSALTRHPDEPLTFYNNRTGVTDTAQQQHQLLDLLLRRYETIHCISCSKEWRALSGWQPTLLGLSAVARNQDPRAYAAESGLDSPKDDFITFVHHYLLPPASTMEQTIKCRAPEKYAFVRALFPGYESPLEGAGVVCREVDDGLLDDVTFYDPINGSALAMGSVNMTTVKGFELLYATPGTGDASEIAGHLLLRIKLDNNPAATLAGVENPHDLVISFLANTHDIAPSQAEDGQEQKLQCKSNWLNIVDDGRNDFDALHSVFQSLKGLSGGFLTLMNRQTLAEAIKTYTMEEDRNLLRYELLLSDEQKFSLLQRLHLAKKSYNARYYFFNQNCASVLVKVMGEGIGHSEIAEFDPLVSPPNTLVALFIRKGLARPVTPAFYSYRKRGYLAQELMLPLYAGLTQDHPASSWPDLGDLFSKSEAEREATADAIFQQAWQVPNDHNRVYTLANLVQESEMVFEHKDLNCENYTSTVTARARLFQRQLRERDSQALSDYRFDVRTAIDEVYLAREERGYEQGTPHTQLFAYTVGYGEYRRQRMARSLLNVGVVLDLQEMGSLSSVAMQRGNYVKLGAVDLALSLDGSDRGELQTWDLTALRIRKLKERLEYIPGFFTPAGTMGLGLAVLDLHGDKTQDYRRSTLVGGELLFNLASSAENNDFLFVALGAELVSQAGPQSSASGVMLPLHLETLMTQGSGRAWQWRNAFDYRVATRGDMSHEVTIHTSLAYRLNTPAAPQLLLKLAADYNRIVDHGAESLIQPWWKVVLGVEVNRW